MDHSTELATHGHCIVPDVLAPDLVAAAEVALDELLAAEADIADERGWHNRHYRITYALPVKHPFFLDLCVHPTVVALAEELLGPGCVLSACNGIDIEPGATAQRLHRDHGSIGDGHASTVQLVCVLDPFTEANGATRVVSGSHRSIEHESTIDGPLTVLTAEKGSVVAIDGAVVHGAGSNTTGGRRRALHLYFAKPGVQPDWDLVGSMTGEQVASLTARQRAVLPAGGGARRFDLGRRAVERT